MKQVVGRRLVEVDVGQFAEVVARHERVTIDVGTGDGRAVLAAAARDPRTLAIGLDADAAAMAESSARAARTVAKGGHPNALFIAAPAEAAPAQLRGLARLVTVSFPWSSLLRGCLGGDEVVAAGLAGLVAPAGELRLLLAPAPRDRLAGLPTEPARIAEAAREAFAGHGLRVVEARQASTEEVRASGSTWAKRLLAGSRNGRETVDRAVVLVRLAR